MKNFFPKISPKNIFKGTSNKIYRSLVLVFSVLAGAAIFFPTSAEMAGPLPLSKWMIALINFSVALVVYGGLGYLGLQLAHKLKFPNLREKHFRMSHKLAIPAVIGISVGIFFIAADMFFQQYHSLGAMPHPGFPFSIVASITAAIGEEIIFRLFFIGFWLRLFSHVLFKKKFQNIFFWVIALLSALIFALGHLPSTLIALNLESVEQLPNAIFVEMLLLNGVLSILAAYYFKKYGFLAAVGIHLRADIVRHVVYGGGFLG